MNDLMKKQLELEAEMHGAGILRFERNNERAIAAGTASEADWFMRLTREFVRPMSQAIDAYKDYYAGRRGKPSATLGHLTCIESDKAAYIAIKTIFDALSGDKIPAQALANNIGRRIEDEIRFTKLADAAPKYINAIKESLKKRSTQSYKFEHDSLVHAEKETKLLDNFQKLHDGKVVQSEIERLLDIDSDKYALLVDKVEYAVDFERWIPWSVNDCLQLGAKMIDIFANNMLLDGKPLIEKVTIRISDGKTSKTPAAIVPTEHLEAWVEQYKQVMGVMSPAYEPCVVPPKDWKTPFNGGYHSREVSSRLPLVKCRNRKHLRTLTRSQMPAVYESVNALQAVKWQIQPHVLAVANEIRLRGLPLGMPQMDIVEKPICPIPSIYSELRGAELMAVLSEEQKQAFTEWKQHSAAHYSSEQKRKSDVREVKSTINQALKFSDYENLHFVYTLDFRGRIYAQGSLVSPQGNDLQKSLIRFADAVALGDTGEFWFKVQGANVWGWDKEQFVERVSRVGQEDFQEMCRDIAADPISFKEWTKADKPWQFLAWCFEYVEYLEWIDDGNDGKDFMSRVAVAMDGSCSGIQHYSAMLRDSVGGKEVNLVPSDKPQDIYGAVAKLDIEWMENIIEGYTQDVPIWDKIQEKFGETKAYQMAEEWLRICITRSMTKKPVMTLPYGSSQMTCRESMQQYLDDLQDKANKKAMADGKILGCVHNFTKKDGDLPLQDGVSFASMITWKAIGEVVIAARAAMKYIKKVSNIISELGHAMEWTTPTGFIVHQAVFEIKEDVRVLTNMLGSCKFRVKEDTAKIDVKGMASSAAPNFVHSMDASHLTLATQAFKRAGLHAIAVIHDSFGTHAGNTEKLRKLLINSFVDMYLMFDVISLFKTEQEERLMMEIDVEVPEKGDLDLEEVRKSPYAFA